MPNVLKMRRCPQSFYGIPHRKKTFTAQYYIDRIHNLGNSNLRIKRRSNGSTIYNFGTPSAFRGRQNILLADGDSKLCPVSLLACGGCASIDCTSSSASDSLRKR